MRDPASHKLLGYHSLPGNRVIHYRIINRFCASVNVRHYVVTRRCLGEEDA